MIHPIERNKPSSTKASAILKRKAPQKRNARKSQRTDVGQEDQRFRFFDLAAEPRNVIYAYKAEGQTAHICYNGPVMDPSSCQHVSEQLAIEYSAILGHCAGTMKVEVRGSDFRGIVTFINCLSINELSTFARVTKPGSKILKLSLLLSYKRESEFPDACALLRWLNRAGHATKKGTTLEFNYTCYCNTEFSARPPSGSGVGYLRTLSKWQETGGRRMRRTRFACPWRLLIGFGRRRMTTCPSMRTN